MCSAHARSAFECTRRGSDSNAQNQLVAVAAAASHPANILLNLLMRNKFKLYTSTRQEQILFDFYLLFIVYLYTIICRHRQIWSRTHIALLENIFIRMTSSFAHTHTHSRKNILYTLLKICIWVGRRRISLAFVKEPSALSGSIAARPIASLVKSIYNKGTSSNTKRMCGLCAVLVSHIYTNISDASVLDMYRVYPSFVVNTFFSYGKWAKRCAVHWIVRRADRIEHACVWWH